MDKQIYDAFDELKMRDECVSRIQYRMHEHRPARRIVRYSLIAAACMLVIVLICANPNVVQALENTLISIDKSLNANNDTKPDIPKSEPDIEYRRPDGSAVFEDEKIEERVYYPQGIMPFALLETADGVFFTGNGEYIELTNILSEEAPFTYVYTDDDGIMHYIAIGLFTAKGEQHVGYHEWLRIAEEAEEGTYAGWTGGGGGMIPNDPEETWGWLEAAKEEFDVPWS